jgi:hypothetical protein
MTVTLSPHELERSEAEAYLAFQSAAPAPVQAALGMRQTRVGGGVVTTMSHDVTNYWNKALGLGFAEPVTDELVSAVLDLFRAADSPLAVLQIAPSQIPSDWSRQCERHGLREGATWVKLAAPAHTVATRASMETSSLLCGRLAPTDAVEWGRVMMQGLGMPVPGYSELAAATAAGQADWYPHAVWRGTELVGTGALRVSDGIGQMMAGTVLPHARRLGGQTALLGARARLAAAVGCEWVVAETGEWRAGSSNSSLHNMLRLGFTVQYSRTNWIWNRARGES